MSTRQNGYEDSRALPIFIDRELDDFGLDPYQFRIYARIARRAGEKGAYESIKNMATGCQMSEGKVKSSLKVLIECGLVTKESCVGGTSIYRLTDKSEWIKSSKDLRSRRGYATTQDVTCLPTQDVTCLPPGRNVSTPPGRNVPTPPGRNVSTPQDVTCLQRYSIEDTPVKGTPVEENPPIIPQNFSKARRGDELPHVVVEEVLEEKEIQVEATSDKAVQRGLLPMGDARNDNAASSSPRASRGFPHERLHQEVQSEIALDQKVYSSRSMIPARENNNHSAKIRPIQQIFEESGKVISHGSEYKDWIQADMGDVIKHYRRSGRALTTSPNDVDADFKSFTAINANGGKGLKLSAVQGWVVNCEKDPLRWGELRDLVAEWMLAKTTGDRHLNVAQEIDRASKAPINLKLNY